MSAGKSKVLVWLLGGCLVVVVLGGVVVSAVVWWGYHKAKAYAEKEFTLDSKNMTSVAELWPDVPPMEGMTHANQIDMPVGLKVVTRKMLDLMMKGLNNGKDAGHWDETAFNVSGKTPKDVVDFYVPSRMTPHGWQAQGGCVETPVGGSEAAVFCAFQKQEGDKATGLLIVAANGGNTNETSLFFLRQEGSHLSS